MTYAAITKTSWCIDTANTQASFFPVSFPNPPGTCKAVANPGWRKRVRVGNTIFSEHLMHLVTSLSSRVVPEAERMSVVDKLFGLSYVLKLEPTVFSMAERLAADYHGAYWQFNALSNNGFYMAPQSDTIFDVCCENGFEGKLSANALGLAATLYAYSHLSFGGDAFADLCGNQYHLAREYMFQHPEAKSILRAID